MVKKVIFATDFSEASVAAMEQVKWLKEKSPETAVEILHVFNSAALHMPAPYYFMAEANTWISEHIEKIRGKAGEALEKAKEEFGGDCTVCLREGKPEQEIVEYAKESGADMIVMGTHGLTGLNRWVLGSVAEYVVRHSSCAVLTVRTTEKDA
ncbi:MAG: universal stress protein [Deltaproteobacteria bacterium]|nr:universal stress protein [Deltaproteobacteria bacterium]MBU47901.1 universal stress protein [Deltaproteobacteria bacterium]MBU48629.1 universal stress protein [Deltaproteobacteria bacterium]|tara:strand:- start:177 stop:635 length:459 start_codon:yes stop_codon:yes gene_type:complete